MKTMSKLAQYLISSLLIIFTILVALPASGHAQDRDHEQKVLLLIVDRLTVEDLIDHAGPALNELIDRGGLGLLNVKGGRVGSESGYLSIGTGNRAVAGSSARLSFTGGEEFNGQPASTVYYRYMGEEPSAEVFTLSLPELGKANEARGYEVVPGALGDVMACHGKKIAVFGNADTDIVRRPGVLAAMDRRGLVAVGDVSERMLIEDPAFPYGRRTDVEALARAVTSSLEDVSLVVVDWGDMTRIDEDRNNYLPARVQDLMHLAFTELDRFLGNYMDRVGPDFLVMMVSPSPPLQYLNGGRQLTPLIVAGGRFDPGVLTGPTTRRGGLVANIDIPATILEHLGIKEIPPHIAGFPLHSISHMQPREHMIMMAERIAPVYEQRQALLKGYLVYLTLTLLAGALALISGFVMKFKKAIVVLVEGAMIFPVTLLLLAAFRGFPPGSVWTTAMLVIACNGILLGLANLLKLLPSGKYVFWAVLGSCTSLLLVADLIGGATWQQYSFLGYDPVAGARFYGIGNEYMGAMIGSTILGTVALLEILKSRSMATGMGKRSPAEKGSGEEPRIRGVPVVSPIIIPVTLYYIGIIFLLASPSYGANVGGTLAAAVAFALAVSGIIGKTGKLKASPVFLVAISALTIILFWAFNYLRGPGLHWHMQSFCEMWSRGDLAGIQGILGRKLAMNMRLFRYSVWSYALVAFMGLMVLLFYYPVGRIKILKERNRYLFSGIMAIVAGSMAALLFNDSGVVAAAMTLLFGVPPLLVYYLDIGNCREEEGNDSPVPD